MSSQSPTPSKTRSRKSSNRSADSTPALSSSPDSKHKPKRVVVVMSTDMSCFREAIRGINAFANTEKGWHIDWISSMDDFVSALVRDTPDGLLLGPVSTAEEAAIAQRLVPNCVGVIGHHSQGGPVKMVEVDMDDVAVGQMAAEYFLGKGYRNFAFFGTQAYWSDAREKGFADRINSKLGVVLHKMETSSNLMRTGRGWAGPRYGPEVVSWLKKLPKPVALLACNDLRARALSEICHDEGLRVPEDVAIMGVDNDDLECELSHPPLSSIQLPWRQAGYRAATILSNLLDGEKVTRDIYSLPPVSPIERQSTATLAIADVDVAAALKYIRENSHKQIGVTDVLVVVPAARRTFEKRFRSLIGHSPLDEIRRVHVERAKDLLTNSDLSMQEIADRSGFASAAWFTKTFFDLTGETPTAFKQRIRMG